MKTTNLCYESLFRTQNRFSPAAAHTDARAMVHARENAASAPCSVSGDIALGKHRKGRRTFLVALALLSQSSSLQFVRDTLDKFI